MTFDWEGQFNPRCSVPDSETYTAKAQRLSDRARQTLMDIQELRYGNDPLTTLDFRAARSANRPLFVYVHGGYWRARDKRDFSYLFEAFAPADVNIAVLNYDLCPQVTVEHICREIQAALLWLEQRASSMGFDPTRIHACGHSAGAHLLAMTLAQGQSCASVPDGLIKQAYLISGIYELSPVLHISVNQEIRLQPEDVPRLSPSQLPVSMKTFYHVIAGGAEPQGWVDQSADFARHIGAQKGQAALSILDGRHHFSILQDLQTPETSLTQLITKGF